MNKHYVNEMLKDAKAILKMAEEAKSISDVLTNPVIADPLTAEYTDKLTERFNDIEEFFDKIPKLVELTEI
jgi:hypothetical protein